MVEEAIRGTQEQRGVTKPECHTLLQPTYPALGTIRTETPTVPTFHNMEYRLAVVLVDIMVAQLRLQVSVIQRPVDQLVTAAHYLLSERLR